MEKAKGILGFIGIMMFLSGIGQVSGGDVETGAALIIIGAILVIVVLNSEKIFGKKSKKNQNNYKFSSTIDNFTIKFQIKNVDLNKKVRLNIIATQIIKYRDIFDYKPIYSNNRNYVTDDTFIFDFQIEDTIENLNKMILNFSQEDFVRPYIEKRFGYVIMFTVVDIEKDIEIVRGYEKTDINIKRAVNDNSQSKDFAIENYVLLTKNLANIVAENHTEKYEIVKDFLIKNLGKKDKNVDNFLYLFADHIHYDATRRIIKNLKYSIQAKALINECLKMLLDIMFIDKNNEEQKLFIYEFARSMDIKEDEYNGIVKKHSENSNSIELTLEYFGINNFMTNDEKRKVLNKVYFDWNKKLVSNNKIVRERAKEIIDFISNERMKMK